MQSCCGPVLLQHCRLAGMLLQAARPLAASAASAVRCPYTGSHAPLHRSTQLNICLYQTARQSWPCSLLPFLTSPGEVWSEGGSGGYQYNGSPLTAAIYQVHLTYCRGTGMFKAFLSFKFKNFYNGPNVALLHAMEKMIGAAAANDHFAKF